MVALTTFERDTFVRINLKQPGLVWLLHTAEVAGIVFVATIYAAWQASPSPDLLSIPWAQALSHGGYEALGVVLYSIVSLTVKNGTASLNPRVIAATKPAP